MQLASTLTRKGQITIPAKFRDEFGLQIGQRMSFDYAPDNKDSLLISPIPNLMSLKGSFKTSKKYNKKTARKAFIKDVLNNKS